MEKLRYAFGGWPISTSVHGPPIGIEWVNDGLASVMLVAVSFVASVCLIYGGPLLPQSLGRRVVLYYTLILLLISGVTGIVFAGDIFNVFVFLELAALSAYALVGVPGGKALVAAFRYLILGTLGASFYLLGVVFFYAVTGTLNMADMAQQLSDKHELATSKAVIAGSTFMFIGLGIKMAPFPLHGWLPGAYTRRARRDYTYACRSYDQGCTVCVGANHVLGAGCWCRDRASTVAAAYFVWRIRCCCGSGWRTTGIRPTGRETDVCLWWHFARWVDPHRSKSGKSNGVCRGHVLHD